MTPQTCEPMSCLMSAHSDACLGLLHGQAAGGDSNAAADEGTGGGPHPRLRQGAPGLHAAGQHQGRLTRTQHLLSAPIISGSRMQSSGCLH